MTRAIDSTIPPHGHTAVRFDSDCRRDGEPIAAAARPVTHPARPGLGRGVVFLSHRRPRIMFEDQSQQDVESLMNSDREFRQLYQQHKKLDKKVADAELGVLPMDPDTVTQWKREKLAAKDQLQRMYDARTH